MTYSEEAFAFGCAAETLLGILARPAQPHSVGVVVVVGGPQYRAGSHRQFVQLARALAEAGLPVLRFDARGMGDSTGAAPGFESQADDIGSAIGELQKRVPGLERVVLWGLCDGASASVLYLDASGGDPRVAGLCLLNPWVRSAASQARTQVKHYYTRRLREPEFWRKLLRGRLAAGAVQGLVNSLRQARARPEATDTASFQQRMAAAWERFARPTLVVLSSDDYTAREFEEYTASDPQWRALLQLPTVSHVDIEGADHTCSAATSRTAAEQATLRWLMSLDGGWPGVPAPAIAAQAMA